MKRTEFEGMCQLADAGRLTWVENTKSHEAGRVVACGRETVSVEVDGTSKNWNMRDCQELTHGYKINYDEIRKHPDEFDTHAD